MKFNIKKITAVLSAGILAAFSLSAGAESLNLADTFTVSAAAEEVIPEGYTPIHNIEELYAVRNDLDGSYILMNDIDMTEDTAPGGDWDINGTGWEPIGTKDKPFTGTFDGNGHAIIGMDIHGDLQYTYVGLFGGCADPNIRNIKIYNSNINISSVSKENVGGYDTEGTCVGTICGYMSSAFGGISNCFAEGEMSVNGATSVGGIIGGFWSNHINDCYSLVNISGDSENIGGISGYSGGYTGLVYDCYNAGKVDGKAIIGDERPDCDDRSKNCYYLTGTCEGQQSISGVCQSMSVAQMKSKSAFTNWDFENTWVIDSTSSYKYPQLRSCMQVPITEVKVTSIPEKTMYTSGEELDLTGGKVLINHEDNSSGELEITEDMLGEYDMEQVGKQSINVNYINKSASYDITINPKPVSNLKISSLTEDSASLSWDRVSGAAGYIIYKYDSENKKWNEYQRVAKTNFTDDKENLSSSDFKYAVSSYVNIDDVDYISEKTEILKPIDFSRAIINIDDIICDGEVHTVAPEVSYNGKILTEGTDYDITGGDYEVKTPGQYKLILSGKGKFAGDQEVEFNAVCNHDWGENGKDNICTICGEMKYLMGDANKDGEVSIEDADYIVSMIVQGKADELPECADYNGDSCINPSDAYLICCDINGTTPRTSDGKITLGLNRMGGYHGEEPPLMVFSFADEFCAFDFTVCVEPQFEISGNDSEVSVAIGCDKNVTAYSYKKGNTIRFTGYANEGAIGGYNDIINVIAFCVTIPEDAEVGLYETWFDEYADFYVGSSNDNTENLVVTSGILEVAEEVHFGDVNGDDSINIFDAVIVARYTVGKQTLTDKQLKAADVDHNDEVNIFDAVAIAKYTVGTLFPV